MKDIVFLEDIPDESISFAVIMARYRSQWLYCKQRNKDTFEAPGGRRYYDETVEELARRELYEETGIEHYVLFPVARYCMDASPNRKKYGALYFAEVLDFSQTVPEFEIEKVELYPNDELPERLSYPSIQRHIVEKVNAWIAEREQLINMQGGFNPFENPGNILLEIEKNVVVSPEKQNRHKGKGFLALLLTRYCSLECKFCMYQSKAKMGPASEFYEFNLTTIQNAIDFINCYKNLAYLLIAGGGEPFECYGCMLQCILRSNVPKIVIATNGIWAATPGVAKRYISEITEATEKNTVLRELIIRISVDKWHLRSVTIDALRAIVSAVKQCGNNKIKLEFHSILGDSTLSNLCKQLGWEFVDQNEEKLDTSGLEKRSPQYAKVITKDGMVYPVAYAKLFHSDLFCDLADKDAVKNSIEVYDADLMQSQSGNFSLVHNSDESIGLDWLLNYNGNITTWCNYQLRQAPNVKYHDANEVINRVYADPISYSHLHDSVTEREKIVMEVDPVAVIRSKAINVRDYSAAYMLYEDKTRLYFALRQIARYRKDGLISILPNSIERLIGIDCQTLKYMYATSEYSILNQISKDADQTPLIWKVFFRLIRSGHFAVGKTELTRVIIHVSELIGRKTDNIEAVIDAIPGDEYQMLTSILTATPEPKDRKNIALLEHGNDVVR